MKVTSDFECGNGKHIEEVAAGHWRIEEVGEKAPYCKYFCVRVDGGEAGGAARVDVYPDPALGEEGRTGMLGHYPAPLWFSEEAEMAHWVHVENRWPGSDRFAEDHLTTRVVVPAGGSVYVASNVVLPWSRLVAWAEGLRERGADVDSLGRSFEGRDIPRVHLPSTGDGKLSVLVLSGQHPSEHCGPLAACGIADFLTSAHPEAAAIRQACDVWLVPMINVDGNVRGRNGWTAEDVNPCSDFTDASPRASENRILWAWLTDEFRPDVYLNFHGYLGRRRFADPPYDGCYVFERPDEVYEAPERRRLYEAVRDTLFWDTSGLTARATPGALKPSMLAWHLARRFGTITPFYEINHAFHGVQGARRKGADVFRAVMRTLLAR